MKQISNLHFIMLYSNINKY